MIPLRVPRKKHRQRGDFPEGFEHSSRTLIAPDYSDEL